MSRVRGGPHSPWSAVSVVIPALDEAAALGGVLSALPPVGAVLVVDNGSVDGTDRVARAHGAQVVHEPRRGYGSACLAGLAALDPACDIVVFMDADGSDDPARLPDLVAPILAGRADLVIGSRTLGVVEAGALTPPQKLGNALAARWLRVRFGMPATDLGPFRAIRRRSLVRLALRDRGYGFTVEMQLKAARAGLRYLEVPVPYRKRAAGRSKITGTVRGTLGAGVKIIGWLLVFDLLQR